MRSATRPFSSKKTSVGVYWIFSAAASCFSVIVLPSGEVSSRSPQMLMSSETKWRCIFAAIAGCLKFTSTSRLQYGQPGCSK